MNEWREFGRSTNVCERWIWDSVSIYPICRWLNLAGLVKISKTNTKSDILLLLFSAVCFFSPFFLSWIYFIFDGLFVIFSYIHTLHLYAATKTISISFKLIDIYVNKNDSWLFVHVVILCIVLLLLVVLIRSLFFLPFHLFISLLLFGNISRFNLFRLLPKEMFSAVVVVGGIFFNSLLWCDMLAAVNSHIKWFVMGRACLHSFALILQPS